MYVMGLFFFFFFQAEDGIRDPLVTGVQTCALPICRGRRGGEARDRRARAFAPRGENLLGGGQGRAPASGGGAVFERAGARRARARGREARRGAAETAFGRAVVRPGRGRRTRRRRAHALVRARRRPAPPARGVAGCRRRADGTSSLQGERRVPRRIPGRRLYKGATPLPPRLGRARFLFEAGRHGRARRREATVSTRVNASRGRG